MPSRSFPAVLQLVIGHVARYATSYKLQNASKNIQIHPSCQYYLSAKNKPSLTAIWVS